MNSGLALRLIKANFFIASIIFIGYSNSALNSQIGFAVALALYIIELYKGEKK